MFYLRCFNLILLKNEESTFVKPGRNKLPLAGLYFLYILLYIDIGNVPVTAINQRGYDVYLIGINVSDIKYVVKKASKTNIAMWFLLHVCFTVT